MAMLLPALLARVFNCANCDGYEELPSWDEEPYSLFRRQEAVKVLVGDGRVLEFPHRMRCWELLAAHPYTRLFPGAVLVGLPGQMVPEEAVLVGGQIYALLPSSDTSIRVAFTAPKEYLVLLRSQHDYSSGSSEHLFRERAGSSEHLFPERAVSPQWNSSPRRRQAYGFEQAAAC